MLNHAHRHASAVAVLLVSGVLLWQADARGQSAADLPDPAEPWLADPSDRYAGYNEAQIACYQGSMRACDSIWLDERILMDSLLAQYGRTCGGRVNLREIRRANITCSEAFPDHE
jgi:hypothetical protein